MSLNVRLQLESLDGRWLPDATPTGSLPPSIVIGNPPPPNSSLMDTPEFRAQLEKVTAALGELNDICREYARRQVGYEIVEREREALQAELDRRIAANEDQGDLPAQVAIKGVTAGALLILANAEAAKYAPKVADVNRELAALNALAPGANISVSIPALDAFVTLERIDQESPPTLPPGVG